jgi:dihydrodipicolinate synthase/N-acetylneuraminate lyase
MRTADLPMDLRDALRRGMVIPAHPLALDHHRQLDIRRQRALTRYYLDAGAGGLAVGVHTTQFAIRDPAVGLLDPVLTLASETLDAWGAHRNRTFLKIAGICGRTDQAVAEAGLALERGYHAGLLSLAALNNDSTGQLIDHCREVAQLIPLFGFYLQPAVGGRLLPYDFWRRFVEIDNVLAIKIAPFNRYQTLDVLRAVSDAGRQNDIALYTGNDDHILLDLLTVHQFGVGSEAPPLRIVGGLLGQWAVWTRTTVEQFTEIQRLINAETAVPPRLLTAATQLTDANAALFDAVNGFRGCIPGIHEVLRRQGLLAGIWCLDPHETLSPGQREEIDRVCRQYPHLSDDTFVREHLDEWLGPETC